MEIAQKGFSLIELMVIVAVVAFLATIALPAYQNYVIRTKIAEIMVFADSARSNLSEYYLTEGQMPVSAVQASVNTNPDQSDYIGSVTFATTATSATITYTVTNLSVAGNVALVGTATANGIQWNCATPATTLSAVYLPQNCR